MKVFFCDHNAPVLWQLRLLIVIMVLSGPDAEVKIANTSSLSQQKLTGLFWASLIFIYLFIPSALFLMPQAKVTVTVLSSPDLETWT